MTYLSPGPVAVTVIARHHVLPAISPLPATQLATLLDTQSFCGNVPRYVMALFSSCDTGFFSFLVAKYTIGGLT